MGLKGDVKTARFLVEAKITGKKQYTLKKSTWDKINKESFEARRDPLMAIEIDGLKLFVMSENTFLELLNGQ